MPIAMSHLLRSLLAILFAAPLASAFNNVVLDISPGRSNPRNSEGAFLTLKTGRILLFYTEFYGGTADDSPARIVSIASDDGGRTWSATPQVVVTNVGGRNVMSASVLRLHSGRIALFHLVKNHWQDCRPCVRFSTDEARTWSEPRLVVDAPGYFVLNNDRVIQLKSGRLIAPVAFHRARVSDPHRAASFDGRALALWYLSDDDGQTWREADTWWAIPVVSKTGLQEPGVVELAEGKLFCWARTDQGAQYGLRSGDGGKSWSAPEPTELKSPVSPASIKRLPASDDLLAIYNDHSGEFSFPPGKRTPLVAAISSDGGKTWPTRRLLEDDPEGWYCYTAIHFVDDAVLLGYCAGDSKIGRLNRLRIRRVDLEWLRRSEP
jgi:sialidase-1